jgi:hypothetical protein
MKNCASSLDRATALHAEIEPPQATQAKIHPDITAINSSDSEELAARRRHTPNTPLADEKAKQNP